MAELEESEDYWRGFDSGMKVVVGTIYGKMHGMRQHLDAMQHYLDAILSEIEERSDRT